VLRRYFVSYNDDPGHFVWVKTADEILASIERILPTHLRYRH
jgi:hypothetical protein